MINCRKIAMGRDRKQERSEVRLTLTDVDPAEMIFAPSQGNILADSSSIISPKLKMNYSRFINSLAAARKPFLTRQMMKFLTQGSPDLVFLAGGLPNPEMFPFESCSIKLKDGSIINMEEKLMEEALQYGPTPGNPSLLDQISELQEMLHNPPLWEDTDIVITTGSQDGLCKAIEMMMTPNSHVIVQEPCYAGTLSILNPFQPRYVSVPCDAEGMIPEFLRKSLESKWTKADVNNPSSDIPKMLYLTPVGSNPTGDSIPLNRRKEIYQIAHDFDLIILEDDPYYFIDFEKDRTPSFLSLDVDGRVIRFDSLSKVLSSGIRIGYVTGPKALLEPIMYHMQVSLLHTSSLCQVMTSELMKLWGKEGFLQHTERVKRFYLDQREIMLKAAEKHLKGLAEWNVPLGGMFLWIKCLGVPDTYSMVMERALQKDVILLPGRECMTDPSKPCPYMRASFSLASAEKMDQGFRNLAELIREEMQLIAKK